VGPSKPAHSPLPHARIGIRRHPSRSAPAPKGQLVALTRNPVHGCGRGRASRHRPVRCMVCVSLVDGTRAHCQYGAGSPDMTVPTAGFRLIEERSAHEPGGLTPQALVRARHPRDEHRRATCHELIRVCRLPPEARSSSRAEEASDACHLWLCPSRRARRRRNRAVLESRAHGLKPYAEGVAIRRRHVMPRAARHVVTPQCLAPLHPNPPPPAPTPTLVCTASPSMSSPPGADRRGSTSCRLLESRQVRRPKRAATT